MTTRDVTVHIEAEGDILRGHLLRLPLARNAGKERPPL